MSEPTPNPEPYHAPQPQPVYYVRPTKTNGLAVASMVLGIVWAFYIGSILAVIFGHIALKQIDQRGDSGKGMAIAGLVLGYIGVGVCALLFLVAATA